MELTLTGASLSSSSPPPASATGHAHAHGPGCQHDHSHSHSHYSHSQPSSAASHGGHGHGHGHSHSHQHQHQQHQHQQHRQRYTIQPNSSLRSLQSQLSSLTQNPPALFLALVGTIKVGTYESFKALADGVVEFERNNGYYLSLERAAPASDGAGEKDGSGERMQSVDLTGDGGSRPDRPGSPTPTGSQQQQQQQHLGYSKTSRVTLLGQRGEDGHTLAHWAAKRADDTRFLDYLSRVPVSLPSMADGTPSAGGGADGCGVDLNLASTDSVGMRPMHWAATEGSIPMVALLLRHLGSKGASSGGSGASTGDGSGPSRGDDAKPSSAAAADGDKLGSSGNGGESASDAQPQPPPPLTDPINSPDASGCTPLLIAAQYGQPDLAAFLLKRGADPMAVDNSRDTALHWAAYKGSVPVCGLLLHLHGVAGHIDGVDAFGQTPLHLASLRGNVEVVQYLLDEAEAYMDRTATGTSGGGRGGAMSALGLTSVVGRVGRGRDPSGRGGRSQSSDRQSQSFAGYLLNVRDRDGKTALDLAIKKKKTGCELLLREYMDKHSASPAHLGGPLHPYLALLKRTCLDLFSVKSWRVWMGMTPEAQMGAQMPKFPFYYVIANMTLAFSFYPLVFLPILGLTSASSSGSSASEVGVLWDRMGLHLFSLACQAMVWTTFVLTYKTDPGSLGNSTATAAVVHPSSCSAISAQASGGGGGVGAMACCGCLVDVAGNADVRREMVRVTRGMRREYDVTLESYSEETTAADAPQQKREHPPLCHSCHIAKPLRSKHCRVSRRCVLLFDHHCPFVGATIGLYNYRWFYLFLLSLTLSLLSIIVTLILYVARSSSFHLVPTVIGSLLCLNIIPAAGMLIYHTQLISTNLTTNEHQNLWRYGYLQDEAGGYQNPFDRGAVRNVLSRLSPGEDSYVLPPSPAGSAGAGVAAAEEGSPTSGGLLRHGGGGAAEMVSVPSGGDAKPKGAAGRRAAVARQRKEEHKELLRNVV